jgi:16S rRNA (guanine1207-N2)-methyltransferase
MYHDLYPLFMPEKLTSQTLLGKAGVLGFPHLEPTQALLMAAMQNPPLPIHGPLLDLTAMCGVSALLFPSLEPVLIERSRAALTVLEQQFGITHTIHCALPSQLEGILQTQFSSVCAVLPAHRGNEAVSELLEVAHRLTAQNGLFFIAGDKDRGFERYFKWAKQHFGEGEILERHKGLRVAVLRQVRAVALQPTPLEFGSYTLESQNPNYPALEIAILPGVFSARGVDIASKFLLETLNEKSLEWDGKKVLDIGAGSGVLAAWAAQRGAKITALEEDWAGVLCIQNTLERNHLAGDALHSDVGSALPPSEQFDLILSNPPFHVGESLILEVAAEFIALAGQRLQVGGELYMVANVFLPYEKHISAWGKVDEVARSKGFKILRGRK